MALYVDVILPLPLNATFSYEVPDTMAASVATGSRVLVPFGRGKSYTGIVTSTTPIKPRVDFEIKEIISVLDPNPVIRHPQLAFWDWMSGYYMCSIGDVYKAAVPSGLKVEGETVVMLSPEYAEDVREGIDEHQALVCMTLEHEGPMSVAALRKALGFRAMESVVSELLDKGWLMVEERIQQRYKPKYEMCVRLTEAYRSDNGLSRALQAVKGSPRRETLLLAFGQMVGAICGDEPAEVTRAALLERSGVNSAILSALVKTGILEIYRRETSRFAFSGASDGTLPQLSEAQRKAQMEIEDSFREYPVTLLHGVTSSGKTEIYINLIDKVLRQGRQVLYLVPEIALTTQLTSRLQKVFGDKVVIYHSRFSDAERVEIWQRLLREPEKPCLIVGARSAVFLPFSLLGLVIVDEEHENSYKQFDPAPRYNARDAAIMLASMHGAKTLLGSATPAVETYYKAKHGKFGLVELFERYDGAKLPDVEIVDMKLEHKRKAVDGSFSTALVSSIRHAVTDGHQAIVFHNRRGYSPFARCKNCAYIPKCQNCDVSLTYHRRLGRLVCHYCGMEYAMPQTCPVCNEPSIEVVGYGTERVESDAERLFPEARLLRMDLDTTRSKDSYSRIIDDFSKHRADILIGTQMVTKGLDFGDVNVVGVLRADAVINFPDFRSAERAFCMLEQVSGRAGRRKDAGRVLIQSYNPDHPVLREVAAHDYSAFFSREIRERQMFNYPPFTRIVYIYMKHRTEDVLQADAAALAEILRGVFGSRISGPDKPEVGRVQTLFIRRIMLKVEVSAAMRRVKELLLQAHARFVAEDPRRQRSMVYYDVDPY